jgi:hypothetical protein
MKSGGMKTMLISFILFLSAGLAILQAQVSSDTTRKENKKEKPVYLKPYHRNVIKFNPTPMVLLDVSNITISYERLL